MTILVEFGPRVQIKTSEIWNASYVICFYLIFCVDAEHTPSKNLCLLYSQEHVTDMYGETNDDIQRKFSNDISME